MASVVQRKLLENDLHSLEELVQILHSAADDKIKRILFDVKNWLSQNVGAETRQSYEDVKKVTESAISFVSQICQQIGDDWVERTQQKMSAGSETLKSRKSSKSSAESADINSLTTEMKAVEEKMITLSQTVDRLKSCQDLTESSVDNMSSRFSQLKNDVKVKSDDIDNTMQEMTTNMGRVQTDLERMRNHIQHLEDRDNVRERNTEMMNETVQSHISELTAVGKKSDSSDVAFTASVSYGHRPVKGRNITGYEYVRGNKDLSFCKDTGIFTAPVKGLYAVCVRQWQWGSGEIGMDVIKINQSCSIAEAVTVQGTTEEKICRTQTRGDGQLDFCLAVTELGMDDTLRIVPFYVTKDPSLDYLSTFSVFLINI